MSDADPIPAVFAPIRQLRNGPQFADLEMHHFTPEEMIWLCKTILNESQLSEFRCEEYAQRHNIPYTWILSWLSDYEQGKDLFHVPQDCPLDAQSIHNLCNWPSSGDVQGLPDMILLIEQEFGASEARKQGRHGRD